MLGVGIDSGGTHSSYIVDRGNGPEPGWSGAAAVSLSKARGDAVSREAAAWICHVVAGFPDDEVCVWIGAAGYWGASVAWIHEVFEAPLNELRETGKHIEMFIANDGVSILKAPPLLGRGVAAIVGTGSVVMGAHPDCADGVIKRGGLEWLVSDEGSGVWLTLQAIRLLLKDIQQRGAVTYESLLLDRLCDYFEVDESWVSEVPDTHQALTKIELLARVVAEGRTDAKRRIAGFVYPHLFDLATVEAGKARDPIAAQVVSSSVEIIAAEISSVAEVLAAQTSTDGERLQVIVGGNIAAQATYARELVAELRGSRHIASVTQVGEASTMFAALAHHFLAAPAPEQRIIASSFDPIHSVTRLL